MEKEKGKKRKEREPKKKKRKKKLNIVKDIVSKVLGFQNYMAFYISFTQTI